MSENGTPTDALPPPAGCRRVYEGFHWFWEHAEDKVALHFVPTVTLPEGIIPSGEPVVLIFEKPTGWENFQRDVSAGGHTPKASGLTIARELPDELKDTP